MARSDGRRIMGCPHCACGVHRGCVKRPLLPGYHLYRNGEAKEDCMCLPKNKLKAKREEARTKKAELSMQVRVAALEKVLWGKSFEGKLAARRPRVINALRKKLL